MSSRSRFQTVWKINALLILAGGTALCSMLGYVAFDAVRNRLRPNERPDVVNVEPEVAAQWRLGRFEEIAGAEYLFAPLESEQSYSAKLSEKVVSAARNYLFVNLADKSSHWLLPANDRLILTAEMRAAAVSPISST